MCHLERWCSSSFQWQDKHFRWNQAGQERFKSRFSFQQRRNISNTGFDVDSFQQFQRQIPRLVHGWFGSFFKPVIFLATVAGGSVYLWNSEDMRMFRRKLRIFIFNQIRSWDTHLPLIRWWYRDLDELHRCLFTLIGLNVLVFLMWKLPFMRTIMSEYFMQTTLSRKVIPLLLSIFSHRNLPHLAFNMFALYSFGSAFGSLFGSEQLMTTYMLGGAASSLSSHLFRLSTRNFSPSLGASGAVFALVSATCFAVPDSRLFIIFFPFIDFSASTMLPVLILFDVVGLLGLSSYVLQMRLDHAAHLGGVACGIIYVSYLIRKRKNRWNR